MPDDGSTANFAGSQVGDQRIDQLAQTINNQGADVNRVLAMMELMIKNAWDDQQQRDVRQTQADYHREMTRQRLEKIAVDVAETQRLGQEARRWLIGLTVALGVLAAVILAVVADRMGLLLGAGAALTVYYVRTR